MKAILRFLSLPLVIMLCSPSAFAAEPISKSRLGGVTIDGHDTVAYHDPENIRTHTATPGSKQYSVEWMGATWRFNSQANADAFMADPDRYRPAYGGHCANALSLGEGLIRTDGETWEIFEDQLYVFYAPRGRERWNGGDWRAYRAQADSAWQAILDGQ